MSSLYHGVVDKLVQNIKTKNSILDSILDLTIRQGVTIREEDIESLEMVISQKEDKLNQIEILNLEFESMIKEFHDDSRYGLEETRERLLNSNEQLKLLAIQTKDIVKVIREVDSKNVEDVKSILLEIKQGIRNFNKAQKIDRSYNNEFYSEENSYYFDSKK
jgi:hypothetical protein